MSKTIVALSGVGSSGKTTTIGVLYHKLTSIVRYKRFKVRETTFKNLGQDFIAIVEDLLTGKFIGITSQGDTEELITAAFERINELAKIHGIEINIYVFACRTKGAGKGFINNIENSTLEYFHKNKTTNAEDINNDNEILANQILVKIETIK